MRAYISMVEMMSRGRLYTHPDDCQVVSSVNDGANELKTIKAKQGAHELE